MRKRRLCPFLNMFLVAFLAAGPVAFSQIAADECKFLGNVISSTTPSDFITYWNQVTPENAGKWGSVEATRDVMNWSALDNAYRMAKQNGLLFRQHTFVWGQQQPAWIESLTPDEQLAEVEEWIQLYCERYPDTDFIDVVNEPLHATPSYKKAMGGHGLTGWDWVIWAFEKARQHCPNAKLFLNDYNVVSSNGATTSYLQIINALKADGLIDGIGEQGHFPETTPMPTVEANLDRLAGTDLPIQITEFDINVANDAQQKSKYEEVFPVLWSHPGVEGITLWGYKQSQIWREDAYLVRANGSARPALSWLQDYITDPVSDPCTQVAVEENSAQGFSLYANPLNRHSLIGITILATCDVSVIDFAGNNTRNVGRLSAGVHSLELALPAGLYILRLQNATNNIERKLIVF